MFSIGITYIYCLMFQTKRFIDNYLIGFFFKKLFNSQVTECIARSDSDQYDLTSLVKTKDNWSVPGGGGTFYINVCRMLNLYDDDDISGCSGTASVCLKKDDGTFVNLG